MPEKPLFPLNPDAARPRAMMIGTCRMHDPVSALRQYGHSNIRSTPHRLHTPAQTLKFVRHMNGLPQYAPETIHLFSDCAAREVSEKNVAREAVLGNLDNLAKVWHNFDVFVIEICSLREHMTVHPRRPKVVNTFAQKDQILYADALAAQAAKGISAPAVPIEIVQQSRSETLRQMRRIKAALDGRPIIWVCHQSPPSDAQAYALVNKSRSTLAAILRAGANALGGRFFDPSTIAAEMGQQAFFKEDGGDLNHMTPAAAQRLGAVYAKMIVETPRHHSEAPRPS